VNRPTKADRRVSAGDAADVNKAVAAAEKAQAGMGGGSMTRSAASYLKQMANAL